MESKTFEIDILDIQILNNESDEYVLISNINGLDNELDNDDEKRIIND